LNTLATHLQTVQELTGKLAQHSTVSPVGTQPIALCAASRAGCRNGPRQPTVDEDAIHFSGGAGWTSLVEVSTGSQSSCKSLPLHASRRSVS
jgi:hypothetical protein